ncbi:methylated-DNA--[protein]-cysteine S-methyltransferase [Kribbella sandramycini]|uniref:Methylated-DNA--protein-cysteine methyltransferase n=1 Tax=Kribbella sandramycini TaxID=60450 RepID=A0A7Y4L244_9ACTN|nr:methylated-DNA--[protein]-cysteine S-methyltransferase [Kribbella sandramycini]MBB6565587.1 methylated-DNA-[protein]-cysteine S-methyltransferase [Kribbella sandramycini]NOL41851.1 methylated-DNA--[protein]-cysteine S-methyltransferase [Kribbella sandramycini]
MRWSVVDSPIGELSLAVDDAGLCRVTFQRLDRPAASDPLLSRAAEQLTAYFAGELQEFDLPLSVRSGSEFERAVWGQLSKIPYGEMQTYGEVARIVGDAGAARAVGTACNRNPLPVVVPCHRVVGAGGKMVGFGGGIPTKRHLLELEARISFEDRWT